MRPMIAVDIDLADRGDALPTADADALVLVWWHDRVLGSVVTRDLTRPWSIVREELRAPFADEMAMIEAIPPTARPRATCDDASSVCVVVCTRDRSDQLRDCLTALEQLDPPPGDILVVDNAPSDSDTADLCEAFDVRRVVEPKPGLSHARNAGIAATEHDLIAFTDDDARPHRRWASALASGFFAPEVEIVTGLIVADELFTLSQRRFERHGGMAKGFVPTLRSAATGVGVHGYDLGAGANMAFRRSALERIGGFDARLGPGRLTRGADDLDAFVRIIDSGGSAFYEPDAVVRHVHRTTMRALWNQYRDNGVGFTALLVKYRTESATAVAAASRELRRRGAVHYGIRLLRALRRRDQMLLFETAAEFVGSRQGQRAFEEETRTRCC